MGRKYHSDVLLAVTLKPYFLNSVNVGSAPVTVARADSVA